MGEAECYPKLGEIDLEYPQNSSVYRSSCATLCGPQWFCLVCCFVVWSFVSYIITDTELYSSSHTCHLFTRMEQMLILAPMPAEWVICYKAPGLYLLLSSTTASCCLLSSIVRLSFQLLLWPHGFSTLGSKSEFPASTSSTAPLCSFSPFGVGSQG